MASDVAAREDVGWTPLRAVSDHHGFPGGFLVLVCCFVCFVVFFLFVFLSVFLFLCFFLGFCRVFWVFLRLEDF